MSGVPKPSELRVNRRYRRFVPPRSEYVIDGGVLTSATRVGVLRQALDIVSGSVTHAETDIPWHKRGDWPADVVKAADLLCGLFVPDAETHGEYVQTGVQPVDEATREAFIAFAPYAYDCTLWGPGGLHSRLRLWRLPSPAASRCDETRPLAGAAPVRHRPG